MNILDACVAIIREQTVEEWHHEVIQTLEYLKATRTNFALSIADREWLFHFLMERPDQRWKVPQTPACLADLLLQKMVTEQEIWQYLTEVLAPYALCELSALLATAEGDPWYGVMIEGKLYCCDCRSLYEGTPLTESMVDQLRDVCIPFCTECGGDL